jgi:hypothetical protein
MNESVRFGRIAGIPVGAHWSVLLMVLIISNSLASTSLPELVPGQAAAAYWVTAVLVAVVFVASLRSSWYRSSDNRTPYSHCSTPPSRPVPS